MLGELSDSLRRTRQMALSKGLAPDNLTRLELLQMRGMFITTLENLEHILLFFGELKMSPQTLEAPIDEFIDSLKPDGALLRDVIIRIFDGEKITRDEVRHALVESGETVDSFKAMLRTARGLREAIETIKNANVDDERISVLRTAKENAIKAVEDEIKRHDADMIRLVNERRATAAECADASYPIHTALSEARNLVCSRHSDEARAQFGRLSNTAVNLDNRRVKLRDETTQLAFRANRLQSDGKDDELKSLPEMQEKLATLQAELETVTTEHDAAKKALEQFERDMTSDWRLMDFT
jgi:hypothetical protein